eukprot:CAMPEP_0194517818 /NCGR_PEP_ID=MMETSP0253-20130528/51087_1 /TAXON_ID=2966 /ORGANISM="Noctiluca scintillans" /LENGTH=122 /DNA_ID=CAMNT_0039361815 /DNA_START=1276 /DNA_END=1644 /DNA_ORIENTATION=-
MEPKRDSYECAKFPDLIESLRRSLFRRCPGVPPLGEPAGGLDAASTVADPALIGCTPCTPRKPPVGSDDLRVLWHERGDLALTPAGLCTSLCEKVLGFANGWPKSVSRATSPRGRTILVDAG